MSTSYPAVEMSKCDIKRSPSAQVDAFSPQPRLCPELAQRQVILVETLPTPSWVVYFPADSLRTQTEMDPALQLNKSNQHLRQDWEEKDSTILQ